jgi:hypothetical protein
MQEALDHAKLQLTILNESKVKKRKVEVINVMDQNDEPSSKQACKTVNASAIGNSNSNSFVAFLDYMKQNDQKWNDQLKQVSKNFRTSQALQSKKDKYKFSKDNGSHNKNDNNYRNEIKQPKQIKKECRCYNCDLPDHLIAKCPMNKVSDNANNNKRINNNRMQTNIDLN